MAKTFSVIEGITVKVTENGDATLVIHERDLFNALSLLTAKRANGTYLAVARRRSSPSQSGHTHHKPMVQIGTCDTPEPTIAQ